MSFLLSLSLSIYLFLTLLQHLTISYSLTFSYCVSMVISTLLYLYLTISNFITLFISVSLLVPQTLSYLVSRTHSCLHEATTTLTFTASLSMYYGFCAFILLIQIITVKLNCSIIGLAVLYFGTKSVTQTTSPLMTFPQWTLLLVIKLN